MVKTPHKESRNLRKQFKQVGRTSFKNTICCLWESV